MSLIFSMVPYRKACSWQSLIYMGDVIFKEYLQVLCFSFCDMHVLEIPPLMI